MLKRIFFTSIFLFFCGMISLSYAQEKQEPLPKLMVFYSPGCHRCVKIKAELMPQIEQEFKDKIQIEYLNLENIENYKMLLGFEEQHKVKMLNAIPVFYYKGKFLSAQSGIQANLRKFLLGTWSGPQDSGIVKVDLVSRFKSFTPLAITVAGLVDGINPCAFTVIVFFISFLALQGYRRRDLVVIGSSFIASVFFTYIIIGLGLLSFIYKVEGFWVVTKILNFGIGVLSLGFGLVAFIDLIKYQRTGRTDGLALQLPQAVKNQIHSVIGKHYRVNKADKDSPVEKKMLRLVLSAFITGFLVSILEAVCTGQVYLPTITFVMKISHLKIEAFSYLVLYNIMFIVPLVAIFIFALLGVTSAQFSEFLKKHLSVVKILMMLVFIALGVFLIWRG